MNLVQARCLIPDFDGAFLSRKSKDGLWDRFYIGGPQRQRRSVVTLSKRYGINPKTVTKWRKRSSVADRPTGPKEPKSTVLSIKDVIVVAFRRHTLLPLDDCLYALQPAIPHLTRSSLHRCLQRHGISQLQDVEGSKPAKKKFKTYPIGFFHIDIAEVRTERQAPSLCRHRSNVEIRLCRAP
jgi:hypothetical protein